MAHFAQLNENNEVINVIVINNNVVKNLSFPESESIGIEFCKFLYGNNTIWKQASYNDIFRKRFPGIGFSYIEQYDAFFPPKPYVSFVIDPVELVWTSSIPCPGNTENYYWDEASLSWILL